MTGRPRHQDRFFELSEDLHALADLGGVLTAVNAAWTRTLGWQREELVSKHLAALVHPDEREAATIELGRARGGAAVRFVARCGTGAGDWRWLDWACSADLDEGVIFATARDVSDRHLAEREIRLSEERHRLLTGNLPDTLVLITDAELQCTYQGGGGETRTSLTAADFVGKPLVDLYAPYGRRSREIVGYHEAALQGRSTRLIIRSPLSGENFDMSIVPLPGEDGIVGTAAVATNVTEKVAQEHELDLLGQRFRQMIDHSPIGMALVGLGGRWLQVNPALCEILGYPEEMLLGRTFQDLTHPDDLARDLALLEELVAGERTSYEMEKRYFRADGSMVWTLLTVSLLRDEDGEPLHFLSQVLDITDRKAEQSRLRVEADVDALTGALNRRRFEEVLTTALASARRRQGTSALLFLDLDGFKSINDAHGHSIGDGLLRGISAAVEARLRASDFLGRHGGDEFVVLLDRVNETQARSLAEEIEDVIRTVEVRTDSGPVRVGASVGLAMLDGVALPTALEALHAADHEMYRVKRSQPSM